MQNFASSFQAEAAPAGRAEPGVGLEGAVDVDTVIMSATVYRGTETVNERENSRSAHRSPRNAGSFFLCRFRHVKRRRRSTLVVVTMTTRRITCQLGFWRDVTQVNSHLSSLPKGATFAQNNYFYLIIKKTITLYLCYSNESKCTDHKNQLLKPIE